MNMNGRVEVKFHIFSTFKINGDEKPASHLGRFTPAYTSDGTLGRFQSQSTDTMEMRKSSYPFWESNL